MSRRAAVAAGAALAASLTLALPVGPRSVVPTAQAATTLQAVRVIGGPGHAEHYGWGAEMLVTGPRAGNVLVTDYWNFRIVELTPQGEVVGYPVTDDGRHQAPYDVAVNPVNGNIAFGDVDGGAQVDVYAADGRYLRSCGDAGRWRYPAWLDYDATGRLAVVDSNGHRVVVVDDATCAVRYTFASQGGGLGQLSMPRGVDFAADGTLWVNDTGNRRLVQWRLGATSATALRALPVRGQGHRGLLARGGELYAVNAGDATIDVYSQATGALLRSWGGHGTGPGQFVDGGRGITADGAGDIWVGDMPTFRTQKFTPTGQHLLSAPGNAAPPPVGGYNMPESVAAFADGTVAGLDSFNWRVNLHAPDGSPRSAFGSRLVLNYPRGLAAHRSERTLVVGNTDARSVAKFALDGTRLWQTAGVQPWAVAVDQVDGTVYAAEHQLARVRVLRANGALGPTFSGGLATPRGIAVDPVDRSVWVANQGNGRIVHFSATGRQLGSFAGGAVQAADVEVSADTVFLADKRGNTIRMFTKSGTPIGTYGSAGTGLGRFSGPAGLDLVGDRLYVMEMGGERIQELRVTTS